MKRKLTVLMAALLLMSGLTWAQQITWTASEQGYENAQVIESITFDDYVSATFDKGTNNNAPKYYNTGSAIRCYGGNYFTVTSDSFLTEITLGFATGEGTNAITTDCGTYANGTWTGSANSVTFTIGGTNGHRRIATFAITYDADAPTVAEPTFSPASGTYTGAQTVTISCETTGATIYYTTNGDAPTNASTQYTGPITVSETTTIKAIAYVGTDASSVANATYTILTPMTIAEVRAQGSGNVYTSGTVTSCVGTTGYIQDATAAICVYGLALTPGDNITVSGNLTTYKGLLEIANPTVNVLSSGNTVSPTVKTIAEINADDFTASTSIQGLYVTIQEATVTAISGQNTTIAQGENTIVVRGISGVEYAVNDILTLNGNIGCYDVAQIANPQNVTVQENSEPSIIASPTTVNVPCEAAEGTLTVSYYNIQTGTIEIRWFAADGTTAATYDWVEANLMENNNVNYAISANTGEARTAYMKVYGLGTNGEDAYSDLITFSQGHYVADYATLPFSFDGGRADIANTNGLTSSGDLGSDYNSSPKLKFNTTGNWLLLHFLEVPGTLSFDIKGNGSGSTPWTGTFTVMTSADGQEYTELAAFTELGAVETKTFENLEANVRYIKWVYTEKSVGNVALGNIVLYEEGGGPVIETYDLTVEPFANLEIFTFIDDELSEPMEGAGTLQVQEGANVMLSVSANEGYKLQTLMVDGVNHVNDIDEDLTYSFTMPGHDVTISATAVEDVPFEPATYTLATTIESGKTYIIVGSKTIEEEIYYYAMGEQRNNNRAGVAISMDGTTATVETADVHEFVITALEEEGFYSIYDNGYLYAAGSSSNYLRTNDSLDVDGQWEISFDTLCHIVASHSDNRNVMQFNYNGGSPLFSCYAPTTITMAPVSLYVKDEAATVQTQTLTLASGINWCSFFVETNLTDLENALKAAFPSITTSQTLQIQSQTENVKWTRGSWRGELSSLDFAQSYMITVPSDCEITVEGMPLDPAAYTITLAPATTMGSGTSWIGYPVNTEMTLNNAFGSSLPFNGDIVQSQLLNTVRTRGQWRGELGTLQPGQGYMYQSASTTERTFVFPSSK